MLRASALLSVVAFVGCTSSVGSEEPPASAAAASSPSAIAKIVTRDRSITLSAGQGTVRATVLDATGRLLVRDVDVDALQAIDATAYDACHASFASRRESIEPGIPR